MPARVGASARVSLRSLAGTFLRVVTRPRNGAVLLGALYATASAIAAVTPVSDPDVWWVAAAGRQMFATGQVPRQNVFSFVEPSHPWIMHEWALGPLYAWALERAGPCVFAAITLLVLAADLSLVLSATLGRARRVAAGLFMAFLAVGGFGVRFLSARPTHVALLFPMAMTLVAFAPRFGPASLLAAAVIELAWTNVHGSFPMGVALLLVASVDRKDDRPMRLAAAGVAAVVTLINPYGLALHRFVWSYFRGDDGIYREIHRNIVEFSNFVTAWGGTVGPSDVAALAIIGAIAVTAALRSEHRVRALFSLALLALGVHQVRHLELAGLLSCFLLVPYVDDLAERFALPEPTEPGWRRAAVWLILPPAFVLGPALFAYEYGRRAPADWIASGPALLRSIDRVPDGARLYVPFQWAGHSIAYGFPRGVRVFFDPRNDCYSAETFRTFNAFDSKKAAPERTRERLDASGTNAALIETKHPLASFLDHEPGWSLVSETGGFRVYERRP
jgi:hypothetical protein